MIVQMYPRMYHDNKTLILYIVRASVLPREVAGSHHGWRFKAQRSLGVLGQQGRERLDYHCEWPRRSATWERETIVRSSGTLRIDCMCAHSEQPRSNFVKIKLDF